jgi:hypothetical protein
MEIILQVFTRTCGTCRRLFSVNHNESNCAPAFCPFCGSKLPDDAAKRVKKKIRPGTGNPGRGNLGTSSTGVCKVEG